MRVASTILIITTLMIGGVSATQKRTIATGKGEIEIATPSSESVVWIDGVSHEKAGPTRKFTWRNISTGSHNVRVRTVGFEDWNRPVVVTSARPINLLVTQTRLDND